MDKWGYVSLIGLHSECPVAIILSFSQTTTALVGFTKQFSNPLAPGT